MSDRKTVHISLGLLSSSLLWLLKSFISSLVFFSTFLLRLWCLEICYTTSSIVTWSYSLSSIDFQFSFTSYDFRSTCSVFVVSYFLDLVCNLFTPLISFLMVWFSLGRINIHQFWEIVWIHLFTQSLWATRPLSPLIKTVTKFSSVIGYHQPDLSTYRTVCASCVQLVSVIGQLTSHAC